MQIQTDYEPYRFFCRCRSFHPTLGFKNIFITHQPLISIPMSTKLSRIAFDLKRIFLLDGGGAGDDRSQRALRFSLFDGIACSGMQAIIDIFAVVGAVYLKAPAVAIGLLAGFPLLVGSLGQLAIPYFVKPPAGRKRYVLASTSGQALSLVLLAYCGWLPGPVRPWAYVGIFTMQGFFANTATGLWMAWMSDLVASPVRGRYFAWRNRIISLAQLVFGLTAGAIFFRHTVQTTSWSFFAAIFIVAGCFRFLSTAMLSFQFEPPSASAAVEAPGKTSRLHGFLFFCFATALMQGSVAFASPFFNVWFVRDLHFSYFTISAAASATVLGTILALPLWGKCSDRFSHRVVLLATGLMVSTVPVPYVFTGVPWAILLCNFYSGIAWSGYNLSNFNYLLSLSGNASLPERRLSQAMAITGISVFAFSIFGGFCATRLPVIAVWRLQTLFLLSSVLRFLVYGAMFFRLPRDGAETGGGEIDFLQISRKLFGNI